MKFAAKAKQDICSATIAQSLWLVLACSGTFAITALGSDPSWWSLPENGAQPAVMSPQVVTNTVTGVISTNYVTNPYAVVTQGQLKQFTSRAVDELNANLPNGAGSNLNYLVQGWAQDYATNNYSDTNNPYAPYKPGDFTVMNVGQLKYIGNMVWSQLVAGSYTNAVPSWLTSTNAGDLSAANLGQLKEVFNFDLIGYQNTISNVTATLNSDGSVTLNWSLPSGGNSNPIIIGGENLADQWTTIATLGSSATTDTLSSSQISQFSTLGISNALIDTLLSMNLGAVHNPNGPPPPQYAVIDLGAAKNPIKITDSGMVLLADNNLEPNTSYGPVVSNSNLGFYIWSQGNSKSLAPTSDFAPNNYNYAYWTVTDLGEDGTAIGLQTDSSFNPWLAIWLPGATSPGLTPPNSLNWQYASTATGYAFSTFVFSIEQSTQPYGNCGVTASTKPELSSNYIYTVQNYENGLDGFIGYRVAGSNQGQNQTELGSSWLAPDDESYSGFNLSGNAVFPLAVNNSGQCLLETDSNYQFFSGPADAASTGSWWPTSTSWAVGSGLVPTLNPLPLPNGYFPTTDLSNASSLANFNLLLVSGATSQYYCWDGTNTILLPPVSDPNSIVSPYGVNARTTTLSGTGGAGQTVAATQVIGGGYSHANGTYVPVGYIWNMVPSTNCPSTFGQPQNLDTLVPGYGTTNVAWSGIVPSSINDTGAIVGTATYTPTGTTDPIAAGSHGVMLVPFSLKNLADPYQGSTVIGTPSHNDQDTTISLSSTAGSTDINNVAWIAAGDPSTSGNPRMPHLQANIAAPGGTTVWWKLSVIFHDRNGNPYRDFDTGATLTGTQVTQLTNNAETGPVGYSDNIAVPLPTGSHDASGNANGWLPTSDGWVTNAAGTPWNIYQDNDWQTNAARGFFGGDAVLSTKITSSDGTKVILPEQDFYFRIAGENPQADQSTGPAAGAGPCLDYITANYGATNAYWSSVTYTPGATNAPTVPGYWFAYAISKEETDGNGGRNWYNNFLDNGGTYNTRVPGNEGHPNWQNDGTTAKPVNGTGGYGLFQLTFEGAHGTDPAEANFIMPRDWIWNWKSNVQQFLPIIQSKLLATQSHLNYLRTTYPPPSFVDPTPLTTTASATTFNYWESSAITHYNFGSGWHLTPGSGGASGTWNYTPNPNNYLYLVAHKGIENHP